MRLHLPDWQARGADQIEDCLGRLPGVRSVRANALTGNALIRFDPQATTGPDLLTAIGRLEAGPSHSGGESNGVAKGMPAGSGNRYLWAGLRGLLGHALVDTVYYTVTFTQPFGLPLAGLGILHLGLDVVVWTAALAPLLEDTPGERGA
jgi:hypothetical protein